MRPLLLAAALALAVAGCGDAAAENHGYGWAYDAEGVTGLRVRYDLPPGWRPYPIMEPGWAPFPPAWFEAQVAEMEACSGLTLTAPPLVIVVEPGTLEPVPTFGTVYLDTRTIVLDANHHWAVRHETLHLLLHDAGLPLDRNLAHDDLLFDTCR